MTKKFMKLQHYHPQVLVLVCILQRPLFHLHFTDCIKFSAGSESSLRKHLQEPETECSKDGTKMNIVMQAHLNDESRIFEEKVCVCSWYRSDFDLFSIVY